MFLHFSKTSAIIAPTLAKEPLMKTTQKKSKAATGNYRAPSSTAKAATGNYRAPSIGMKEAQQLYEGDITRRASGGMVTGYKNGGCVMSGRGSKYKGSM